MARIAKKEGLVGIDGLIVNLIYRCKKYLEDYKTPISMVEYVLDLTGGPSGKKRIRENPIINTQWALSSMVSFQQHTRSEKL